MPYRYDEDLEFLRKVPSRELDTLVKCLVYDEDGTKRISEMLSNGTLYEQYYPDHQKYIDDILSEIQQYGGNTAMNLLRLGRGVKYKEILCDVLDKLKIPYNKNSTTEFLEDKFFDFMGEKLGSNKFNVDATQVVSSLAAGILTMSPFVGLMAFASGPAYSVTVPAVLNVGLLRRKYGR